MKDVSMSQGKKNKIILTILTETLPIDDPWRSNIVFLKLDRVNTKRVQKMLI